jgi:hypothetical protein
VPGTHSRHIPLLASYLAIEMAPMDKAESIMGSLRSPLCHYSPRLSPSHKARGHLPSCGITMWARVLALLTKPWMHWTCGWAPDG